MQSFCNFRSENFLTKTSQPLNIHTNTGQITGLLVVILVNAVHLFSIVRNRNEYNRNGDLKRTDPDI